ncbi:type II toxin-antitoxin system HigB family toxin [Alkaliflexus imshenetskii]|uniref:type II toxin-antitoxin system HigB family toxin n=1 Tax=Alkaliflexus imshenetskii TaxID=286730 RepID=UPI000478AA01|nr:type II toxin-antitoxin system HigB family toxin [Alkaliflexus imshenetskii]
MKVHLIKKQSIEDYVLRNARSKASFEIWLSIIKRVDWAEPNEIITTFNSADILGNGSDRVVFNIGGNNYRLICKYHFGNSRVHLFIKWIGTSAQYTKLCNEGKQYEIDVY